MTLPQNRRRMARNLARVATGVCATMLAICLLTVVGAERSPAGAATNNGEAAVVSPEGNRETLDGGGSATHFTLNLGPTPTCPGDSASGNYRVQSFMVPATANLDAMTFDANGPVSVSGQFRQPLYDINSSPYVNKLTDIAVPPSTTGGISQIPAFNFGVYAPGDVPAGEYAIGIACTLGTAGPDQLKTFWVAYLDLETAAGDSPAGFTWTVQDAPSGGTTTTTTGDTTTTTTGDTTTTTTGDTTTTTTGDSTTTTVFTGSDPSNPSASGTLGDLPLTGSSPGHLVAWGLLLIVFGRMALLLGRRPGSGAGDAE